MLADSTLFTSLLENLPAPPEYGACGPDLEYDPRFLDFLSSSREKPERQLGNQIIPAQAPDWRAVMQQGTRLSMESRDLRIAVVLTQAATELTDLSGLVQGLLLIHSWLEQHWDDLHPTLNHDGERDPLVRMNALASLADPAGCLKAVRQACFLDCPIGTLSLGDAESILKGRTTSENAVVTSADQMERLLSDESERNAERLAALTHASRTLAEIDALWRSRVEAEYWPELGPLKDLLNRLSALGEGQALSSSDMAEPIPGCTPETESVPLRATAVRTLPERVTNRHDAFLALAVARRYFESHEPSHPAPLLIRRIEKLADLGFAEILAELTPDALAQLRHITGENNTAG